MLQTQALKVITEEQIVRATLGVDCECKGRESRETARLMSLQAMAIGISSGAKPG